ncbi:MAG: ATP-binding protein [Victivallaceae bacterium]|nr:ATP-binding protein [Victivallaceae bacterium]
MTTLEIREKEQAALRERVKELSCLYEISLLAGDYDLELKDILLRIAELIPAAWQYPDIACARITLDDASFTSADFEGAGERQSAPIVIKGKPRGRVEVFYREAMDNSDEGPFLREERNLINSISKQLALIIERAESRIETNHLQQQLQHADRLATIGQFTAGLAHELNEPLVHILGFAQIVEKNAHLPKDAKSDVASIVRASLHAREIVRKLLIFARQVPGRREKVQLNDVVKDAVYFISSRCRQNKISLRCRRARDIAPVSGDRALLTQVLVNLAVNAIQAMPEGGRLHIETRREKDNVILVVRDNGIGIADDIKDKIFMPFFTTKDIGSGTGLGLSVVHGIVSSHGGAIEVASMPGAGTKFTITFPAVGRHEEYSGNHGK